MMAGPVDPDSRAFTNVALADLRESGWSPGGWVRFLVCTGRRSAQQVAVHRRAAVEVTLVHGVFLLLGSFRRRTWWWVGSSWAMTMTHLGLLGRLRSIGWPNVISLARANLPVTGQRLGRWLGVTALVSDKLDGGLARREGPTMMGFYADSLADAAFWTWFGTRRESGPVMRGATVAAWVAPIAAAAVVSIRKGEMVDIPRPALLRPAAALQVVLAVRAWHPGRSSWMSQGAHHGMSTQARRVANHLDTCRRSGLEAAT